MDAGDYKYQIAPDEPRLGLQAYTRKSGGETSDTAISRCAGCERVEMGRT